MAQQFDWLVVGRDKNVTSIVPALKDTHYDLLNYTIGKVLRRRVREGIDLEYAESAPTKRNVGFSRKTGDKAPLKYGELFSIHVAGISGWIVYKSGQYGINLVFSDNEDDARYQWRFDHPEGGHAGETIEAGTQLGLYNTVVKDHLMCEQRSNGIDLKWFKDQGEFNGPTTIIEKLVDFVGKTVGAQIGGPVGAILGGEAAKFVREKFA